MFFGRRSNKKNMMLRVLTACIFVILIVLFLVRQGIHGEKITFDFLGFFVGHKILSIYLGIINIVTFIMFGIDKLAAIYRYRRVKIVTLLGMCFVGGSVGGLCAMYLFHHKTNKNKNSFFTAGVPLMILTQAIVLFYMMNL